MKPNKGIMIIYVLGDDIILRLKELEAKAIKLAIREAGGHYTRAARLLGMNRTTFLAKRKRLGLYKSHNES